MTYEEVYESARHQPFIPFRVILTTGDVYDIRRPDLIFLGRRSVTIGMTNEPNGIAYERTIRVDLLHIVGLQELPVMPPTMNGPGK